MLRNGNRFVECGDWKLFCLDVVVSWSWLLLEKLREGGQYSNPTHNEKIFKFPSTKCFNWLSDAGDPTKSKGMKIIVTKPNYEASYRSTERLASKVYNDLTSDHSR